jgi:GTPase SAR1 family protein
MSAGSSEVTYVLIGDMGVGKSEFGNRYLGHPLFASSGSPYPVTLELKIQSTIIDDLIRDMIDTEGHADWNSMSSKQIQKLASFLRQWEQGVHGICVMLNGQNDRFSQGVKDMLR